MSKNIPWSKPDIGEEERDAVRRVMESGWVTCGPETEKFERELERYIGCKHVAVVNNGTAALISALSATNMKHAYLPAYAYHSTVEAAKLLGIEVTFGDIDEKTVQMVPPGFKRSVPISFAGLPLDVDAWICPAAIVEDAGESFGAESRGVRTGAQGWTATFSFHAAKTITTVEGGAVATGIDHIYERVLHIRSRVLNFKPTDIGSAIGRAQLRKVDSYLKNREEIARIYRESLAGLVEFQEVPGHVTRHANMMFPIFVDESARLAAKLRELGIETRLGWPPRSGTPACLRVSRRIICLPIFNTMSAEDAEYVLECVKKSL